VSWFSDWGGSAWAEDVSAAKSQADTWLASVAGAKGWTSASKSLVAGLITSAADSSKTATAFWSTLHKNYSAYQPKETNADKLGATFASAAGAATTTAASRDAGSVATVVGGALSESVDDVVEIAEGAGGALSLLKSPVAWVVLAALGAAAAYHKAK
jgi:hypothetical protein